MLPLFSINLSFLQRSKRSITHREIENLSLMDPFVSSGRRALPKTSGGQGDPFKVEIVEGQNWIPGQATRIRVNALALSSFIRLINWRAGVDRGGYRWLLRYARIYCQFPAIFSIRIERFGANCYDHQSIPPPLSCQKFTANFE